MMWAEGVSDAWLMAENNRWADGVANAWQQLAKRRPCHGRHVAGNGGAVTRRQSPLSR